MAKCSLCNKEDGSSDSCIRYYIEIDGKKYNSLPYKAKNKTLFEIQKNILKRCPGCGVKEGGYHHVGCIVEICPKCNHLWVSCRCSGIKRIDKKKADIIHLFSCIL